MLATIFLLKNNVSWTYLDTMLKTILRERWNSFPIYMANINQLVINLKSTDHGGYTRLYLYIAK